MKKYWLTLCIVGALLATTPTVHTQKSTPKRSVSSAIELRQFRDAWLFGDNKSVEARLGSLNHDDRILGELPRWVALLRAGHALRMGKFELADTVVAELLENAKGPRPFIQAMRLFLLHEDIPRALNVATRACAEAPDVATLKALKADMTLLNGDAMAALGLYTELLASLKDAAAPYTPGRYNHWDDTHNFKTHGGSATPPDISLFVSLSWYDTKFPGLEHCLNAIAQDKDLAAAMRVSVPGARQAYGDAQDAIYAYRGSDTEARADLETNARTKKWELLLAVRIAALAAMENQQSQKALDFMKQAEDAGVDDIAYQDLLAQVLGELGMAEEARTGPLARLRQRANLGQRSFGSPISTGDQTGADRVFTPALNLYRANPESGKQQFEELRMTFGYNPENPVPPSFIGMWLAGKGELELARHYLEEGSNLAGYLGGKQLYGNMAATEFLLWSLGSAKKGTPEDAAEDEPARDYTELLNETGRAGAVLASLADTESLLTTLAGIDIWGGGAGMNALTVPLPAIPEGRRAIDRLLFNYPTELAKRLTKEELETLLDAKHPSSVAFALSVETLSKSIEKARSNDDWRSRDALSDAAGPFFGKVEARTLLIRSLLVSTEIKDLPALKKWCETWLASVDLRTLWSVTPDDALVKARQQREKAGVPEISHSGLLIDAANKFADAGDYATAANLLWHNRDCYLGTDSNLRMMALAAAHAENAKLKTLAVRCRLFSFDVPRIRRAYEEHTQLLLELPNTREHLERHGRVNDVIALIEAHYSTSSAPDLQAIYKIAPEFAAAPKSARLTDTNRENLAELWQKFIPYESNSDFLDSWGALASASTANTTCDRLLDHCVASDFPLGSYSRYTGLVSASDFILILGMKAYREGDDCFAHELLHRLGGGRLYDNTFTHSFVGD
ncbi:hypothetical protein OAU50_05240 [Planctomycetota bacterium]|nr:hypothetical protein [Planctomycetota bacterium]